MEPSQLLAQLRADGAAQVPNWVVTGILTRAANVHILNVQMEHPASHGLVFSVEGSTKDPRGWLRRAIEESEEIAIVSRAPALEHQRLVLGVRSLSQGFRWSSTEVRSLAFLLYEADALIVDEAAWLAGYCGANAPMSRQSPLGPRS